MQITIRPASSADVESIYTFICDLEETTFDFELFQKLYQGNILEADNIYLVAESPEGETIGFISAHGQILLHHLGMVYEIQELFVHPEFRGKGIGHQLIGAMEGLLRERECRSFEVSTNAKRAATQEFYAACGFGKTHVKFTKEW